MPFWMTLPETEAGWVLWCALWAVQVAAAVVIVRGFRGRRPSRWEIAALAFVIVGGPGAALIFLFVRDARAQRARRKAGTAVGADATDGS